MDDGPRVKDDRARFHFGIGDLVFMRAAAVVPHMAAGHHAGGAILPREVRNGPDRVQLRLDRALQEPAPGEAVTVQHLRFLPGLDADDLREVQLEAVAEGRQEGLRRGGDQRMGHQLAAGGRARNQRAGARCPVAGEVVAAGRCRLDIRHDFRPYTA
jgi:hypothetical protein